MTTRALSIRVEAKGYKVIKENHNFSLDLNCVPTATFGIVQFSYVDIRFKMTSYSTINVKLGNWIQILPKNIL